MTRVPAGTVTLLFTDIEGSTRLLEDLGDRYVSVVTDHHRLLRAAFKEWHGREISTEGDAFFVAFSRARDAVAAAVAAQRALSAHTWPEQAIVRVRMGLHTGEPVMTETGYEGMDVHRAARICDAAHGGQILLSAATHALVETDLPRGLGVRDLGAHRLRDLARAERLFQVTGSDLMPVFPPLRSLDALLNNLPRQLTSFIGREREVAELKRSLSETAMVTLTGSAGVGKTRLALRVASELVSRYPDGAWLIELAALSDANLIAKEVASALSIPEQPRRSLTDTLVDALHPKSLLLILDNCEHLLAGAAQLAAVLLGACAGLRIVATSREPLGVSGEVVWRVPSLSAPNLQALPPVEELLGYEAVRLFVERAALSRPGFRLTSSSAPAVAQVACRLDGIPLAIELAAAQVKVLSVDSIATRLDDRFRLLTSSSRTGLPRHQTLRAMLNWSHDLLSERERILFRRLSVFAGDFTLEATEQICGGGGLEEDDVLELLTRLVDKSLVLFDEREGCGWYRLLESIRQYGHDKLQQSQEAVDVLRRHRDWYLALAEQAEPEIRGPAQVAWLDRLEAEHDNFRGALHWCAASAEAEPGLRLACALWWFWYVRGHHREARERLAIALRTGESPPLLKARALRYIGYSATVLADAAAAQAALEQALAIARTLEDGLGAADALHGLGRLAFWRRDFGRAAAFLNEARRLFAAADDKNDLARVLNSLGYLAAAEGRLAAARTFYTESLMLCRETGNKWLVGYVTGNLGVVALREGAFDTAWQLHRDALAIWREVKHRMGMIAGLEDIGLLEAARGQAERAARLLGAAEAGLKAFGLRLPVSRVNANVGDVLRGLRSALGDDAATARIAEGRAMTLEQAVRYALAEADWSGGQAVRAL